MKVECVLSCIVGGVGLFISLIYEHVLGYQPCIYCLALRILYGVVILVGLVGLKVRSWRFFTPTLLLLSVMIIVFSWAVRTMECCMLFVPTLLGLSLSFWSIAGGLFLAVLALSALFRSVFLPRPRS